MDGKKGISELAQITHTGKYAVVYDVAHLKGSLYYLSIGRLAANDRRYRGGAP